MLNPRTVDAKWHGIEIRNILSSVHECVRETDDRPRDRGMCCYKQNRLQWSNLA